MQENQLSTKHLLGIKDLTASDIQLIFKHADEFKEVLQRPIKKVPSLRDITVANLFFENSTRTRLSFELAQKRLSADVVNFSAATSSVKKGETLVDTVNNILAMKVDMVVMRHASPGACVFLSQHIDVPIINAGDGTHEHPTQALLDAFSIRERLGDLKGKRVVIVGDITKDQATSLVNKYFAKTSGVAPYTQELGKGNFNKGNRVIFVKKPGAVQSVIQVSFPLDIRTGDRNQLPLTVLS